MIYDVVVIGAGPGGYVAAIRAAQLGLKTCCIEKRNTLGGTCLNVGCIPSKALLHSSELYWKLSSEYSHHGIEISSIQLNFQKMMQRKSSIISNLNVGIEGLFHKNKIDRIQGEAQFIDPYTLDVSGNQIQGKHFILATGSEPVTLPFLPIDEKKIFTSTGALSLSSIPKKLLIIGAGIIGVELGSVYRRLGAEVEFLEFLDRICPSFDASISKALQKSLTSQGLRFHLSHKVVSATIGKTIEIKTDKGPFSADAVLVSIGRKPYTTNLGLEKLSIQKDQKGFIQIDSSFRTSIPHIFAIGDLVNGPSLAHKASEEGIAVAELIAHLSPTIDYATIPNVAYTFPEVASVGFTEEELKAKSISYLTGQFPFKANSRARCTGEDEGFVKVLADSQTKKILGVHILGPHASELIAEAVLAMKNQSTLDLIIDTCHAHPTLSEAFKEACLAAEKKSIHI